MIDDEIDGVLNRWSPCRSGSAWFVVCVITGDRKGRFRDGALISTSVLVTPVDQLAEGVIIETLHSRYRLGPRATQVGMGAFLCAANSGGFVIGPDGEPVGEMAAAAAPNEWLSIPESDSDVAAAIVDRVGLKKLKDVIEAFEERMGERVEAVAIGRRREWGDFERRPLVEPVSREEAMMRLELHREYEGDMGSCIPPDPIFAWTASWVLLLSGEDHGVGPAWVPRPPAACVPEVNGMDESI